MYAKENYIGKAEPGDSLAQILAHRPTMHNFSVATGLEPVAKKLEGDTYSVCDLQVHGVHRPEQREHTRTVDASGTHQQAGQHA